MLTRTTVIRQIYDTFVKKMILTKVSCCQFFETEVNFDIFPIDKIIIQYCFLGFPKNFLFGNEIT